MAWRGRKLRERDDENTQTRFSFNSFSPFSPITRLSKYASVHSPTFNAISTVRNNKKLKNLAFSIAFVKKAPNREIVRAPHFAPFDSLKCRQLVNLSLCSRDFSLVRRHFLDPKCSKPVFLSLFSPRVCFGWKMKYRARPKFPQKWQIFRRRKFRKVVDQGGMTPLRKIISTLCLFSPQDALYFSTLLSLVIPITCPNC